MDEDIDDDMLAHSSAGEEEALDRSEIFMPVVQTLVGALGGFEEIETPPGSGSYTTLYRPGDSVLPVLKDLKRLWRKDDTDDERTVARCFGKAGLCRELVGLLEECAERGEGGRKIGLACADLLCALTWPIDVQQELKELEDEPDVVTDYVTLLRGQVEYKATILRSGDCFRCLMFLLIPSLAKSNREKQDKDKKIISLMLHLVRNLLAIRDPAGYVGAGGDELELSTLQSTLILQLEQNNFLSLFLTLASQARSSEYNEFNMVVLDSLWLMLKGVEVSALGRDLAKAPMENLSKLLEEESRTKRIHQRASSSRHSRFGTTIAVQLAPTAGSTGGNPQRYVLHKQNAIKGSASSVIDGIKKGRGRKLLGRDELGQEKELTGEAMVVLKEFVGKFVEHFNAFFQSVLKDLRMLRSKVRETDHTRSLYLIRFFIQYFLILRAKEIQSIADAKAAKEAKVAHEKAEKARRDKENPWDLLLADDDLGEGPSNSGAEQEGAAEEEEAKPLEPSFGFLGELLQEDTMRWMQSRLVAAADAKPKIPWVELQACLSAFTQMLLFIECISQSNEEEFKDAAASLSEKLLYEETFHTGAADFLKSCATQSLPCQDTVIHFAYVILKTLERYSKTNEFMAVRKRRRSKKKAAAQVAGEIDMNEEEEVVDDGPSFYEQRRAFKDTEDRYLNEQIVATLVNHLSDYREFKEPDQMKWIVGLMHRMAVKRQAEAVFFKVSALRVFHGILADERSLQKNSATKDLLSLINYILRRFFKSAQTDPLLLVEAFFPKGNGAWKQYSSYKSDDEAAMEEDFDRIRENRLVPKIPVELEFKPDRKFSWSEQMGIAIRCLIEAGKMSLVTWLIEALGLIVATRQEIILHTDGEPRIYDPELDDERPPVGPSDEAKEKMEDQNVTFNDDEHAKAGTFDQHLRLMLKLVKFETKEDSEAELLEWYMPKTVMPADMESSIRVIKQFMLEPIELDGESPEDVLRKKRKKPTRRRRSPSVAGSNASPRPRKQRKQAEVQHYKSAAFIEDSDDDPEADAIFFAKEEERRKANRANMGASMLPTGKKKRKAKGKGKGGDAPTTTQASDLLSPSASSDVDMDDEPEANTGMASSGMRRSSGSPASSDKDSDSDGQDERPPVMTRVRKRPRIVDPDDESE